MSTMKYASLDLGTIEAVFNKLGGTEGAQRLLRGELVVSESPKLAILNFHEDVLVGPLTKQFVPNESFKNRPGLYLWNDMSRVLRSAQIVKSAEATKSRSFDLTKDAYDRDIKAELPTKHEIELWQIAELIGAQEKGEDGSLLTNGYANIFYVAGCAVRVRWDAGRREWFVSDWGLDDDQWHRGPRVFSSN